jgi:hypothetical protein
MRFFKKLAMKRCMAMLSEAKGETFTAQESMHVFNVLDKVISADGIIKYFDTRVTLSIQMETQLPNAVAMLNLLTEINGYFRKDIEATLPEYGTLFSEFRSRQRISLYDWLSDNDGHVIDVPQFYRLFNEELSHLITVIVNCEDESTQQYYLRKLQPLYNELLETVYAALHCGLLSL